MAGLGCSRCDYTGSYVAFEGMGNLEQEFDCPNCSPDPDLNDVFEDIFDDSGDDLGDYDEEYDNAEEAWWCWEGMSNAY